jgi:hypothetical protein
MLFALTRSNLLRQLSDGNGTILRLTEIVTVSNSIGTYFCAFVMNILTVPVCWDSTNKYHPCPVFFK